MLIPVVVSPTAVQQFWKAATECGLDVIEEHGGAAVANRLKELLKGRKHDKQLKVAMDSAVSRFASEYDDEDLIRALTQDTSLENLPALLKVAKDWSHAIHSPNPQATIAERFAEVLPPEVRSRAERAVKVYTGILEQELLTVAGLREMLTASASVRTAASTEAMADDVARIANALTPDPSDRALAREKYLEHIVQTNTYMDPRGIMQTHRSVTLRLDEVYVSLTVEREPDWASKRLLDRGDATEAERLRIMAREPRSERVDLAHAVRESRRAVILGDPGAGKTTLTRFLALHFARALQRGETLVCDAEGNEYGEARLPILVRIADYAGAISNDRDLSLREYMSSSAFNGVSVPCGDLLCGAVDGERAIVLLDGLDEIVEASHRNLIAGRIEAFAATCPGCRIIVTSRIAGYREARLAGDFAQLTIQNMKRPQIERFLDRWCHAVERFHMEDATSEGLERNARSEIDGILSALDANEGVRRLASNPLLLTILALIHRNGDRLPSRRIELYQLAVNTLLRDWELARGIPDATVVGEAEALRMLGPLAYWIHDNEPTGVISDRDARERLAGILGAARGKSPEDPEVEDAVTDFLRRVREHTGVFVERAPGRYGFMHLTFEEYFAGRELVRRSKAAAERIYRHRHRPRWEEPILLAIGFESKDRPEDAADLIWTAILAEGEGAQSAGYESSRFEDILHRDLFLAARCLGDCASPDPDLSRDVAKRLVDLHFSGDEYGSDRIVAALSCLQATEGATRIAERLLESIKDENPSVRWSAAQVLGEVGTAAPQVLDALVGALKDEDYSVRRSAVKALGRLGHAAPKVLHALLAPLKDEDSLMQGYAAQALGKLGKAPEVRAALLVALKDADYSVRRSAVQALGRLDEASPEVLTVLLASLRDCNEESSVRACAAYALACLTPPAGEAPTALLVALKDRDASVRGYAVRALGRLGRVAPEALTGLLAALNDEDSDVRAYAAGTLGRLEQATPAVHSALLAALKDEDSYVRWTAAEALGKSGHAPEALSALLVALKDNSSYVRLYAAEALGELGHSTPEVLTALLSALRDKDEDISIRASAAEALGRLGHAGPEVLTALASPVTEGDPIVGGYAAVALGQLGKATPEVIQALLAGLRDMNPAVRWSAADALGQLGHAAPEALPALQVTLKDDDSFVRAHAAEALVRLTPEQG